MRALTEYHDPSGLSGPSLPAEPRFLRSDNRGPVTVLVGDFLKFSLTLAFYPVCWLFAGPALLVDRVLRTRLFERAVRAVEYLDR